MSQQIIKSERLNEEYIKIHHPSGLTLMLYPLKGYSTAYALFGTNYGSIDTCFKTESDPDFVTVPEGIAHFLEHKLFESEDLDAFARYAKTGASANAYTSFDRTCYLFSCSDNFEQSLEILLDFVTSPYFTPETVQKEQGIIGQEIKMYDDSPDWRVLFNLLRAMYQKHPVRIDIAGTVESIAQIDDKLLYRCYNTFYNLNNMVLAIAGNFDPDVVVRLCDKILKKAPLQTIQSKRVDEPVEIEKDYVEERLPVSMPIFSMGYKVEPKPVETSALDQITSEILLDILAGESSPLYRRLYDKGLINATFSNEVFAGRDYYSLLFSGESPDPKAVRDELIKEVERLKKEGIAQEDFDRAKKANYGRYVRMFNNVESIASIMVVAHFYNITPYQIIDKVASVTLQQVQQALEEEMVNSRLALSVVKPAVEQEEKP